MAGLQTAVEGGGGEGTARGRREEKREKRRERKKKHKRVTRRRRAGRTRRDGAGPGGWKKKTLRGITQPLLDRNNGAHKGESRGMDDEALACFPGVYNRSLSSTPSVAPIRSSARPPPHVHTQPLPRPLSPVTFFFAVGSSRDVATRARSSRRIVCLAKLATCGGRVNREQERPLARPPPPPLRPGMFAK